MQNPLVARVSPDFIKLEDGEVLVASASAKCASLFTEKGYDSFDIEDAARFIEIEIDPAIGKSEIADEQVVRGVAADVGIQLDEHDSPEAIGQTQSAPQRAEFTEANDLLTRDDVRQELERRGYKCFEGHILVESTEPRVVILWNNDTFTFKEYPLQEDPREETSTVPSL